jgi:transposase
MRFVGLDVHKRVIQAFVCDAAGQPQHTERFELSRDTLHDFAQRQLDHDCTVALEATTNTWAITDVLADFCPNIVVSNPMRTKAIASAKVKSDKVDAATLAHLLRCDFLPRVWIPDAATRAERSLASRRSALTRQSISLKNRLHSVLHQRLIQTPCELFSAKGRDWLASVALPAVVRGEVDSLLHMLHVLDQEQTALRAHIDRSAFASNNIKLLMTLPGVDATTAHAIMAAIGNIARFASADKLAAYFGLVPSVRQSAEHCVHGRITKQGNSNVRWLLIQAAQQAAKHPGPLGLQFAKLERKKNRSVAVVAIAHKLALLLWHLLTHQTPYRYAIPSTVQTKLARLRVSQQGKRKSGPTRQQPRPAAYGTGHSTRLCRSLNATLRNEGLPAASPAPAAETRIVDALGLTPFVQRLQTTTRVPRSSAKTLPAPAIETQPRKTAGG